MSSYDRKIKSVLVRAVPLPSDTERDWEDVLARAEVSTRSAHTRRLLYSLAFAALAAVVLAATPLGAVIARGFGDFSDWLNGKPGQPISSAEQKTIEREQRQLARYSWASFPKGAELRRLITVTRDGIEYKLFGYRVGNEYCLRLSTPDSLLPHTGCAPKSELSRRRKPALALYVDAPIYSREKTDPLTVLRTGQKTQLVRKSSVTFGIVSDGVTSVNGLTHTSVLDGMVASGSFLIITPRHEEIGRHQAVDAVGFKNKVRSILASDASGDKVKVRVAGVENEYASGALMAPVPGRMAKRQITGIRIGWLERRESRGTPLSRLLWLNPQTFPQCGPECAANLKAHEVIFSRQITPDPGGVVRVAVALRHDGDVCSSIAYPRQARSLGGDCMSKQALSAGSWTEGPTFHITVGGIAFVSSGAQYSTEVGLVDDHVRRMTILLSSGKQIPVPIKDNAYVFEVARTDYPIRLVAFDSANRVVGVDSYPGWSG